jgi:hypothetical protein
MDKVEESAPRPDLQAGVIPHLLDQIGHLAGAYNTTYNTTVRHSLSDSRVRLCLAGNSRIKPTGKWVDLSRRLGSHNISRSSYVILRFPQV